MDKAKSEVLRYLGHRNQEVPEALSALVDECIALMRNTAVPRNVSAYFAISESDDGISLDGSAVVLSGKDIARHLSGCERAALLAATLGAGADALIRRWERADLTHSLILDACATQLIEEYCDGVERQISAEAEALKLAATWRFSPGYGDLPLDIQPKILEALNAGRRIGLTCTESLILLPRKSVTAIIGLGVSPEAVKKPASCDDCALHGTCKFRKDGNSHGCSRMAKE